MLIDSHCHLDRLDLKKAGASIDEILDRARARGVRRFLCVGVDLASSRQLTDIAQKHPDVAISVGAHPLQEEAQPLPAEEELVELAGLPGVVAVGETGLDAHYADDSSQWQEESFVTHLKAARRVGKPVIVHTRKAKEKTLEILRRHSDPAVGGVLHCFTEDWSMARQAIDLNFFISFSGIVTFKNARDLREVVKQVPLDRLLVETDSPWLAPVPHRGRQNEPQYVVEVARQVADIKGISLEALAEATWDNYHRLFPDAVLK